MPRAHAHAPTLVKISRLAALSGVPAATIKHYLREGLLPGPEQRTGRTMAYYDARLSDRVKAIKQLQHERFLPLKVISELLEPSPSAKVRADLDRAQRQRMAELAPAVAAGRDQARARRTAAPTPARGRTRKELLARTSITAIELDRLEELGLLTAAGTVDGDPVYGGVDLDVLDVLAEVRAKGLAELFPLSILEPYAAAIRTLVRVEIELFRRQILSGAALPSTDLAQVARDATALGERLIVALRAKLVVPELEAVARAPRRPRKRARKA